MVFGAFINSLHHFRAVALVSRDEHVPAWLAPGWGS